MSELDVDALFRTQLAFAWLDEMEQQFVARLAEGLLGRTLQGTDAALRARAVNVALGLRGPELEMLARILAEFSAGEGPSGGAP